MTALLGEAYAALVGTVADLDDDQAWVPTACSGWTVRDLVWHLRADAVRGLVAIHSPVDRAADCDRFSYWRSWGSDPVADERNRRMTRVEAGGSARLRRAPRRLCRGRPRDRSGRRPARGRVRGDDAGPRDRRA